MRRVKSGGHKPEIADSNFSDERGERCRRRLSPRKHMQRPAENRRTLYQRPKRPPQLMRRATQASRGRETAVSKKEIHKPWDDDRQKSPVSAGRIVPRGDLMSIPDGCT